MLTDNLLYNCGIKLNQIKILHKPKALMQLKPFRLCIRKYKFISNIEIGSVRQTKKIERYVHADSCGWIF